MAKEDNNMDNSFGITSVILGILSILFSFSMIPSAILAILGIIFSLKQKKINKNKWSRNGLILSIIGLVLSGLFLFLLINTITNALELVKYCETNPSAPQCQQIISSLQQSGYS